MIRSLKSCAAGINALQSRMDTVAANIAGVNTDSFKSQRASFADLLYEKMSGSGRPVAPSGEKLLHGTGSRGAAFFRNFSQGDIRQTGREYDMAINGSGFFKIIMDNDSVGYTRNGNFMLNADRELVTEDGYRFYPEIILPEGSKDMSVDRNGKVTVVEMDDTVTELQDITVFNFMNPNGLIPLGKGIFAASDEAGLEEEGIPGQDQYGEIFHRSLEASNVDMTVEITELLESQRGYQINARALRLADEMWGMANNLRK